MFCIQCGQALPDDSRFCLHCGVKAALSEIQHQVPPIAVDQNVANESVESNSDSTTKPAKFQIRDDIFINPTIELITAGLKSLKYDEISFLDIENGEFYQTHNLGKGYRIEVVGYSHSENLFISYEPKQEILTLNQVISIFTSSYNNKSWRDIIQWKKCEIQHNKEFGFVRSQCIEDKDPDAEFFISDSEFFNAQYYINPSVARLKIIKEGINSKLQVELKRIQNASVSELLSRDPNEFYNSLSDQNSISNKIPISSQPSQPSCSKCGSSSITADKKGYGAGKGFLGAVVAGPLGLLGGFMGSKKVRITCLNCGHSWIAGSFFK